MKSRPLAGSSKQVIHRRKPPIGAGLIWTSFIVNSIDTIKSKGQDDETTRQFYITLGLEERYAC
jgi:hypothetical protein